MIVGLLSKRHHDLRLRPPRRPCNVFLSSIRKTYTVFVRNRSPLTCHEIRSRGSKRQATAIGCLRGEGIPPSEWCFLVNDGELEIAPDYLKRTGYRLPTLSEWELACAAGTRTGYSFGEREDLLGRFAWYSKNANSRPHSVGQLIPNTLGLFDMHGNLREWTVQLSDDTTPDPRDRFIVAGGGFAHIALHLRTIENRHPAVVSSPHIANGLRVVRTTPIENAGPATTNRKDH